MQVAYFRQCCRNDVSSFSFWFIGTDTIPIRKPNIPGKNSTLYRTAFYCMYRQTLMISFNNKSQTFYNNTK